MLKWAVLFVFIGLACAAVVVYRLGASRLDQHRQALRRAYSKARHVAPAPVPAYRHFSGQVSPPWVILPEAIAGHGAPMTEAEAPDSPDRNATFSTLSIDMSGQAQPVTTHEEIRQ